MTDAVVLEERLRTLRDELAIVAANEPKNAGVILSLVDRASAYLDSLPMAERWEGDTPILKWTVTDADARSLYEEVIALTQQPADSP